MKHIRSARTQSNFYRKVRLFCEVSIPVVADATGIPQSRVSLIEKDRSEANAIEARLIESFLRDKLRCVFALYGPMPEWVSREDSAPRELQV